LNSVNGVIWMIKSAVVTRDYDAAGENEPGLCRSLCRVKYSSNEDTSVTERFQGSWTFLAATLCRCLKRR